MPTAFPLTVVERTTTPNPPMAQVEHAPTLGHSHPKPSLITADLAPRLPPSDRADIAPLPVAMAKQAPVSAIPLQDDPASAVAPPSPFMITAPTTMAVSGMAQPAPLPDHAPSPLSRPTPSAPTAWLTADPRPATVAHVLTPPDQPTARDQPNATIRPNASAAPPPAVAPPPPLMTTAPTTMAVLGMAQPAPLNDHAPPPLSHPTPSAPTSWLTADPHPATAAHVLTPTDQPTARDQPNATIRPKAVAGPAPLGGAPVLLEPMAYVAPDPIAADLPLADRALPRGDAVVGKTSLPQAPPTALPDLVIRQILPNIGKEGIVSVTLAPVELGALRFEVTSRGEGLHLHLMVDAAATLDLLRRQGDQILAELRQAGFAQASLSFAPGGGQSGAGSPGGDARSGGAGGGASSPQSQGSDPAPLHRLPTAGLGLLDLRL
ncbi:flagellar hook-length control protein FliK [Fuscovulum ytuae]|uniref:Flagellar hook-length control protein FliK n=1 Tax=Fuscovulum ytuae TaxID=3042299 RepID=A0ABY8Q3J4_9RHOB|nr:flagellar hook-length control protein FliK [Fuscovulum sp. YMD61]WGV15244.1 flagellar hook-length control protein FliK [Fuscovulum sp. YMD61]